MENSSSRQMKAALNGKPAKTYQHVNVCRIYAIMRHEPAFDGLLGKLVRCYAQRRRGEQRFVEVPRFCITLAEEAIKEGLDLARCRRTEILRIAYNLKAAKLNARLHTGR